MLAQGEGTAAVVPCGKDKRRELSRMMRRYGLKWAGTGFAGMVPPSRFSIFVAACREMGLYYYTDDAFAKRSTDYRYRFFKAHPPALPGIYFCSYCGRPLTRKKVTVDHLYPVAMARQSMELQRKMRRQGIRNVNDVKNLIPACMACNKKKGAKLGAWVAKGKIGRHQWLWAARHAARASAVGAIAWCAHAGKLGEAMGMAASAASAAMGAIADALPGVARFGSALLRAAAMQ